MDVWIWTILNVCTQICVHKYKWRYITILYVTYSKDLPFIILHIVWKSISMKHFSRATLSIKLSLLPEDTVIVYLALKWCLAWLHWLHTSDLVLIGCQQDCSDWSAVINVISEGKAGEDPLKIPPFSLLKRDDYFLFCRLSFVMTVLDNKFFITGIMWLETY